ncbi:uncharacterized protein LOC141904777 [Tubulanus polymorphus]|uniref:uncharacterized protein LOC141904777 n=1 Tax=Tubulanus polymorphus TaxID=672921 RepID=UPI003DA62D69
MASVSPFTISPQQANILVNENNFHGHDNLSCFLMQISCRSVYGEHPVPQSAIKKLPRLINGIPLGAGTLTSEQTSNIRWRYVEGSGVSGVHTFLSHPLTTDEAIHSKAAFRDRLMQKSQLVFGDVTVKANIVLSKCMSYDADFFINDIADSFDSGLHFKD